MKGSGTVDKNTSVSEILESHERRLRRVEADWFARLASCVAGSLVGTAIGSFIAGAIFH